MSKKVTSYSFKQLNDVYSEIKKLERKNIAPIWNCNHFRVQFY